MAVVCTLQPGGDFAIMPEHCITIAGWRCGSSACGSWTALLPPHSRRAHCTQPLPQPLLLRMTLATVRHWHWHWQCPFAEQPAYVRPEWLWRWSSTGPQPPPRPRTLRPAGGAQRWLWRVGRGPCTATTTWKGMGTQQPLFPPVPLPVALPVLMPQKATRWIAHVIPTPPMRMPSRRVAKTRYRPRPRGRVRLTRRRRHRHSRAAYAEHTGQRSSRHARPRANTGCWQHRQWHHHWQRQSVHTCYQCWWPVWRGLLVVSAMRWR